MNRSVRMSSSGRQASTSTVWGNPLGGRGLVVRADIAVRLIEELLVLVQLVLEKGLAEGISHLPFAGMGALPAVEPNYANDLVNVVDHTFNHDRRVFVAHFLEELGQRSFSPSFLLQRGQQLLRRNDIAG